MFDGLLLPLDSQSRVIPIVALATTTDCDESGLVALRSTLARVSDPLERGEPRRALALLDDLDHRSRTHLQVVARRAEAWCSVDPASDGDWLGQRLACADHVNRFHSRLTSPRVVTGYLRETDRDDQSFILVVDLVLDPLVDTELPVLVSRCLTVRADSNLDDVLESHRRDAIERALDPVVASDALRAMLHLVINAVLYATSAECESRELAPTQRSSRPVPSRRRARRSETRIFTGETVFYLPGKVSIHQQVEAPEPGSSATAEASVKPQRHICKRFPVRGHWRRPPATAEDGRLRWVRPHFRGPSMAAVIERQYRLK